MNLFIKIKNFLFKTKQNDEITLLSDLTKDSKKYQVSIYQPSHFSKIISLHIMKTIKNFEFSINNKSKIL